MKISETIGITGTQLFFRKQEDGRYLVCGLVRANKDIKDGTIVTGIGELIAIQEEDRHEDAKGLGLDGIMTSPFWRLK